MEYTYIPKNVCSRKFIIKIEGDIVQELKIEGGCDGNTKGICSLVKGMKINEIIKKIKGITCGNKKTSCPDQVAIALEEIKQKIENL